MSCRDQNVINGDGIGNVLETMGEDNDRSTKLGRRRLIEDLNEKKMLEAELNDYEEIF